MRAAGINQTVPALTNAGLVRTGGNGSTNLTVAGPYVGQSGLLELHSVLAGDGSPSDRLVIDNGTATGFTGLKIVDAGGLGERTSGNGILVVDDTTGNTTAPGAFSRAGPVVAGPYEYTLHRGTKDTSGPNDWFLRSELPTPEPPPGPSPEPPPGPSPEPPPPYYRQEVSLDAAILPAAALYGRQLLGTFHERFGEPDPATPAQSDVDYVASKYGWGRLFGHWGHQEGDTLGIYNGGPEFDYSFGGLQAGLDLFGKESAGGANDRAGFYFAYGHGKLNVTHNLLGFEFKGGDDSFDAYSFGGYWTHFGETGWYLDSVVQGTWYDMSTGASRGLPEGNTSGFGFGASLEGGYPFDLGDGWKLEPQAQLVYQGISFDTLNDGAAEVFFDDLNSLAGRIGARAVHSWTLGEQGDGEQQARQASVWARIDVWHEFIGDASIQFTSASGLVPFAADLDETWAQTGNGGTVELTQTASLYGNVNFDTTFDGDNYGVDGRIGFKMKW